MSVSDSSSVSGELSLSFSVSSVESEGSELSDVESDLGIVEPYQFEPEASDSPASAESDDENDDSGDEGRLRGRDW